MVGGSCNVIARLVSIVTRLGTSIETVSWVGREDTKEEDLVSWKA